MLTLTQINTLVRKRNDFPKVLKNPPHIFEVFVVDNLGAVGKTAVNIVRKKL